MPAFDDHPILLLLRRNRVTQTDLAKRAGVSRSSVDQIVQGRVRQVNPKISAVLTEITGLPADKLQLGVDLWYENTPPITPTPRISAVLALDPAEINEYYRSFKDWRKEFSDNPTKFASILHINRLTVKKFEDGKFKDGMPATLHAALAQSLGLSDEYIVELGRLKENQS